MEERKDYFTCDYCHRVGTGITIVNGFKMCPMCLAEYQHKSGENNELREELGRKIKEVEQLKKENEELKKSKINKVCVEFGQEKFDKVIDMFQSKAIDELEFLTNQFKDDFAEDIDKKLSNYKEQFEKMYNNNFENMKKVDKLREEIANLKSAQNKVTVEKLEIVKVKLNEFKVDNFSDAYIVIKDMNFNISTMIAELKGEKDE